MSNAILAITDGTLRYSLITRPWQLEDWIPQDPLLKGGGIRRGSPLSDGTRLIDFSYANTIDTFMLKVMHGEQDGAIRNLQDMKRLLEKGRRYWTDDWATEPVWIEARGSDETNIRYAVIKNWALPQGSNPYAQPFFPQQQEAVMEGLVLTLEHDFWQATEPGTGTATEISAQQFYNVVTYGRAATTAEEVYVANRHNEANVSHIFTWTSPAGPFGLNLIGAALPFDIFAGGAGGPANGDITYFGCNTALADSGPFASLVFDIGSAAAYGAGDSVTWEYWNGAWVGLTIVDNSTGLPCAEDASFTRPFVNSIHWEQPSDWATVAINAITGYWVRLVVTEATGILRAQQRNRDIYSIVWPFVELDEADVLGDLPALVRIRAQAVSECRYDATNIDGYVNRIMIGLRSLDRDVSAPAFRSFVNLSDEQNPATMSISVHGTAVFATDTETPSGRRITWSPAGIEVMADRAQCNWTSPRSWYGEYHLFVRYQVTSGSDGDLRLRAITSFFIGDPQFTTDAVDLTAGTEWHVADLGRITLPPGGPSNISEVANMTLHIEAQNTVAAARVLHLYDFILMPVDEWFADVQENVTPSTPFGFPIDNLHHLDLDPLSEPKRLTAHVQAGILQRAIYIPYTAGLPILQANADQKLHFFMMRNPSRTTIPRVSEPYLALRVWLERVDRYQSMRGAR